LESKDREIERGGERERLGCQDNKTVSEPLTGADDDETTVALLVLKMFDTCPEYPGEFA
jgi:hypothetical protein